MNYELNPRKVYGKVNIVYSDGEVSKETQVVTSSDAEISEKDQVFAGYIVPDIKACTMDGNSTMGGGFQMQSSDFVMGWWSGESCDENGNFNEPYPYIELTFTARPIIKFTVIGDSKLNQYPINFDIECFKDATIKSIQTITNNTDISKTIFYEPVVTDINRIRLTIKKWNAPNARAKILQFFDILEETYDGKVIKDFEVLEQVSGSSDSINYQLSSNTASITLYNEGRKFDRGYLKDLVLVDRKVMPYIGVETNGQIEWTSLGTFYTEEWNIPQNDQFLKLKTVDRLLRLQNVVYVGFPYTNNVSLYDIAEDVLTKAGLNESNYKIDERLKQTVLLGAFLQKMTVWDALQQIALASMSYVYVDRENTICITKDLKNESFETKANINPSNMFSYEYKTTQKDFSNYIEVEYSDVQETTTNAKVFESVIGIEPYGKVTMQVDYNNLVTNANINLLPSVGIEIVYFESGINAGKFELKNNSANYLSPTVSVSGNLVTSNKQTVVIEDSDSILRYGTHQYYYSGSSLIQSYEQASVIGEMVLEKLKKGEGVVRVGWRGDPRIIVQDAVFVEDRFGQSRTYGVSSVRSNFDGGLKQEINGGEIDGNME